MQILTKTKVYRFDKSTFDLLSQVRKYHGSEARFVRNAIREKLERDLPVLIAAEKQRIEKIQCPF